MRNAIVLILALISGTAAAASSNDIAGTYQLVRASDPGGAVVTRMQIIGSSGTGFFVQGTDQSWSGSGSYSNGSGAYDWKLGDGRTGRTTFSVDANGDLRGHVVGSGVNWEYIGRRQEGPILLAAAAVAAEPEGGCGVFAGPFPDGPLSYFNVTNRCATNQDCWVWVNKPGGPKYQHLVAPRTSARIDVGVLKELDSVERACQAR